MNNTRNVVMNDTPITKEDVRNLKAAESVVYRYKDGQSYIQVNLKDDSQVIIPCNTVISGYRLGEVRAADYSEAHLSYSHAFRTMVNCMREHDILTLQWTACNNSQLLDRAGLYQDELSLRIERGKFKPRPKRFDFNITTEICENNTAKMIKHDSTPRHVWERQ